jgi:hypothetical protein
LALLLKQQGSNISVWIDIQKMRADIMEAMSEAVSTSDYILMLVSDTYKNSSACKCEAMYAFELKKPVIPIVVEKGYVAAGWLGALIAGKLRYDCSDPSRVHEELPRVMGEIQPAGVVYKEVRRSTIVNNIQPTRAVKTVEDVSKWLEDNGFGKYSEIFKAEQIDGECLGLIRDDFSAFSSDLQTLFGMNFKTKLLFKKALSQLSL